MLQDYGSTYGSGNATHHLTLYRAPSGALVFGAGTVQWSWGLDSNHDRGTGAASTPMKQATVNLFADMGAQPATLQAEASILVTKNATGYPGSRGVGGCEYINAIERACRESIPNTVLSTAFDSPRIRTRHLSGRQAVLILFVARIRAATITQRQLAG